MKTDNELVRIDGVLWQIVEYAGGRRDPKPICPIHHIRLKPYGSSYDSQIRAKLLICSESEDHKAFGIPRLFHDEKDYVLDKIDAKIFKNMTVINIDDEAVPLAKAKIDTSRENPFWIKANLIKSKSGLRLVIYAGEKGKHNKTQIFVEPDNNRLSFDHNDTHPSEVFTKVEATFEDSTKHTIKKPKSSPITRISPPIGLK